MIDSSTATALPAIRNRFQKVRDPHGDRRTAAWLWTLPEHIARNVHTVKCGSVAYDEAVKFIHHCWTFSDVQPEDDFERMIGRTIAPLLGSRLLGMAWLSDYRAGVA